MHTCAYTTSYTHVWIFHIIHTCAYISLYIPHYIYMCITTLYTHLCIYHTHTHKTWKQILICSLVKLFKPRRQSQKAVGDWNSLVQFGCPAVSSVSGEGLHKQQRRVPQGVSSLVHSTYRADGEEPSASLGYLMAWFLSIFWKISFQPVLTEGKGPGFGKMLMRASDPHPSFYCCLPGYGEVQHLKWWWAGSFRPHFSF